MQDWLANIRPPKYLRYLFFIAYCWYRSFKSERDEAHITAVIFLSAIHMILFLGLFMNFLPEISTTLGKYKTVLPICLLTGLLFYCLFLYKNKWKFCFKEFGHIKKMNQRIGLIHLFTYSLICFAIAFYPVILLFIFNIDVRNK